MMMFLTSSMMILSYILLFLNHPLSMGLILIIQSLITAMMTGLIMGTFWFSYILLIIMMSGLLVLFIYMASVASNEMFTVSFKMLSTMMIMFTLFMVINYFNFYSEEVENMFVFCNNKMEVLMLNKLFNGVTMMLTIIMVLYLLFTMIVVTNIVNMTEGPLRIKM